jgi:hypothetical protein
MSGVKSQMLLKVLEAGVQCRNAHSVVKASDYGVLCQADGFFQAAALVNVKEKPGLQDEHCIQIICTIPSAHEKRRVNEEQPTPASKPITQSRQRDAQTTPAHLHWCGADPPSSWPAQAASHGVNAPK